MRPLVVDLPFLRTRTNLKCIVLILKTVCGRPQSGKRAKITGIYFWFVSGNEDQSLRTKNDSERNSAKRILINFECKLY